MGNGEYQPRYQIVEQYRDPRGYRYPLLFDTRMALERLPSSPGWRVEWGTSYFLKDGDISPRNFNLGDTLYLGDEEIGKGGAFWDEGDAIRTLSLIFARRGGIPRAPQWGPSLEVPYMGEAEKWYFLERYRDPAGQEYPIIIYFPRGNRAIWGWAYFRTRQAGDIALLHFLLRPPWVPQGGEEIGPLSYREAQALLAQKAAQRLGIAPYPEPLGFVH